MNYKFFIGIDVSKEWVDVALINIDQKELLLQSKWSNETKGLSAMMKWLSQQSGFNFSEALFIMEHTGIYNYPMVKEITIRGLALWIENAVQIKHSLGLQRGKNDQIDAERIAR